MLKWSSSFLKKIEIWIIWSCFGRRMIWEEGHHEPSRTSSMFKVPGFEAAYWLLEEWGVLQENCDDGADGNKFQLENRVGLLIEKLMKPKVHLQGCGFVTFPSTICTCYVTSSIIISCNGESKIFVMVGHNYTNDNFFKIIKFKYYWNIITYVIEFVNADVYTESISLLSHYQLRLMYATKQSFMKSSPILFFSIKF